MRPFAILLAPIVSRPEIFKKSKNTQRNSHPCTEAVRYEVFEEFGTALTARF